MSRNTLIIFSKCPKCIDFYLKLQEIYPFLFEEFGGRVEKCSDNQYGCDIWINAKGVVIWFETAPQDGVELGYGISLSVDDPDNKLNNTHFIGTILDFIDNKQPPEYKGPGWMDDRISTPEQLKKALEKIIEFYNSDQFADQVREFNEWYERYEDIFRDSIKRYYKDHHS